MHIFYFWPSLAFFSLFLVHTWPGAEGSPLSVVGLGDHVVPLTQNHVPFLIELFLWIANVLFVS